MKGTRLPEGQAAGRRRGRLQRPDRRDNRREGARPEQVGDNGAWSPAGRTGRHSSAGRSTRRWSRSSASTCSCWTPTRSVPPDIRHEGDRHDGDAPARILRLVQVRALQQELQPGDPAVRPHPGHRGHPLQDGGIPDRCPLLAPGGLRTRPGEGPQGRRAVVQREDSRRHGHLDQDVSRGEERDLPQQRQDHGRGPLDARGLEEAGRPHLARLVEVHRQVRPYASSRPGT